MNAINPIFTQNEMIGYPPNYYERSLSPVNSKIEITNSKIVNFYNSHPNINIDEINLYFINIISKFSEDKDVNYSTILSHISHETPDSNKLIQPYILNILSKLYTTADIIENALDDKDIISIRRSKKSKILLKNVDIDINLSSEQVDFFNNVIDRENCCGIILSQKSGISDKSHFQIDIRNKNIVVYIHNANYSQNMITSAIDIIDNLSIKIDEFSKQYCENYSIPKEILDIINSEYQLFINQKTAIIDMVKEYQKKLLLQIDECRFSTLGILLAEKYCTPVKKFGINCPICNNYSANNLKALAAHKRGCIRKNRTLIL